MAKIPLSVGDRRRWVAREASVMLRNRFVEQNPVLSDNDPSFIARPGLQRWTTVGAQGPIRAIFHEPGAFNDDLFVVAFNSLYRVNRQDGTKTLITAALFGGDENLTVRMTATGDIGDIGPRLWLADGRTLFAYMEDGFATGVFTATAIADGDVVRIDNVYYRFSSGSLDSGSPAGTAANPWRVLIDASIVGSYTNLFHAINETGPAPGTVYSTATTEHPTATAMQAVANGMFIRAKAEGSLGNGLVTTETGANMSWAAGTLTGGGNPGIINVPTPDDVGVLDVGVLNSFVIVIPAQGEGINGRFYWIRPGELVIDALDWATAERSPDPIYQVIIFGDRFWLCGQSTTEIWFMTGDPDAPVSRLQGVVFDRGIQHGTAIQVKDAMILVDENGGVFQVAGGEKRVSPPDIEERLRKAIAYQNIVLGE